MDDLETMSFGNNKMKVQSFKNKVAIQYADYRFFYFSMLSFNDDYLGNEYKSISLQLPGGSVPTYTDQYGGSGAQVNRPAIIEMHQVDKDGISQAYKKSLTMNFDGPNPRIDGKDVSTTFYRNQVGFGFQGREQMALVRYV